MSVPAPVKPTETARPTPGPWTVNEGISREWRFIVCNPKGDAECGNWLIAQTMWREHADFIVEAATVFSETGLSPRQLADQRAELLAALKMFIAWDDGTHDTSPANQHNMAMQSARVAIARAEGRS